jgi:hypothetical protein
MSQSSAFLQKWLKSVWRLAAGRVLSRHDRPFARPTDRPTDLRTASFTIPLFVQFQLRSNFILFITSFLVFVSPRILFPPLPSSFLPLLPLFLSHALRGEDGGCRFSETLLSTYQTTRRYNPDDCCLTADTLFYPEDGDSRFLWSVGTCIPNYTVI